MEEALHLFEHRLNEIDGLLMDSLIRIKTRYCTFCLIQAIKPERDLKKTDLLEFLIVRIDRCIRLL